LRALPFSFCGLATHLVVPVLVTGGLSAGGARAQCEIEESQEVSADDPKGFMAFGRSISIHGNVTVIGAYFDDDKGTWSGSAYVYRHDGSSWVFEQKLLASDGNQFDLFGRTVSVFQNVILVGAPDKEFHTDFSGAAYVFRRSGGRWREEQILLPSDRDDFDLFGRSVVVRKDRCLIGSPSTESGDDDGAGYVFRYDGGRWVEEARLSASDGAIGDRLGYTVALRGEIAVLGAFEADDLGELSGSAYVYRHSDLGWTEEGKLLASDGAALDHFGWALAVEAGRVAVGAPHAAGGGEGRGAVYLFESDGGAWTQVARLNGAGGSHERFGGSVTLESHRLLVGTIQEYDVEAPPQPAYLFQGQNNGNWTRIAGLTPSDGVTGDDFGFAVALDGDFAAATSPFSDGALANVGSAYFYELSSLILDIETSSAEGSAIDFTTCAGRIGGPGALALVEIMGQPSCSFFAFGVFDLDRLWRFSSVVAPGLSGLRLVFQSFGLDDSNRGAISNRVQILFE